MGGVVEWGEWLCGGVGELFKGWFGMVVNRRGRGACSLNPQCVGSFL